MSDEDPEYMLYETYSQIESEERGEDIGMVDHGEEETGGKAGAGLVIVTADLDEILLFKRSDIVSDPSVWGIPGGARQELEYEPDKRFVEPREDFEQYLEDPLVAAVSEAREEIGGLPRGKIRREPYLYRKPGTDFIYDKFLLEIDSQERHSFEPDLNWEHEAYSWFDMSSLENIDLHCGVEEFLEEYEF